MRCRRCSSPMTRPVATIERREQRGRPVAHVNHACAVRRPGRNGSIGAVRSSAWLWLFSSTTRAARDRWVAGPGLQNPTPVQIRARLQSFSIPNARCEHECEHANVPGVGSKD